MRMNVWNMLTNKQKSQLIAKLIINYRFNNR